MHYRRIMLFIASCALLAIVPAALGREPVSDRSVQGGDGHANVSIPPTSCDEAVFDLIADGGSEETAFKVGEVTVWDYEDVLYVTYKITLEGWCLTETHLHTALFPEDIPQADGGNAIPGQFDYQGEHDCITEFTYCVSGWEAGDELAIAAHAVVISTIEECAETVWQIGDVEVVSDITGWLENYADEFNWGDPAGPITKGPNLLEEQPPFTNPFIVGTTPTGEFPFNSNFDFTYATDFDVVWYGDLPNGGKLRFSWSPGASGYEEKVVVVEGMPEAVFTGTGTPRPGEGWFWDTYALVEHSTDVAPLPNGEHTINFRQTQGNGTYWDWIRLEEPCAESAWGDGFDFPGANWSMYFEYTVGECSHGQGAGCDG